MAIMISCTFMSRIGDMEVRYDGERLTDVGTHRVALDSDGWVSAIGDWKVEYDKDRRLAKVGPHRATFDREGRIAKIGDWTVQYR